MSAPSRKWRTGVSPRYFFFITLCLVWIKKIWKQGGLTPVAETPSSNRVALRILSNINDGVPPQKQLMAATHRKAPLRGCKLVYKEVVEALSDYKRFNLWWFGDLACGDPTGSNWIKNNLGRVSLGVIWRKRVELAVQFSMCWWRDLRWWR